MLSPYQLVIRKKKTGVLHTAKLTMQHLVNQNKLPIQIFIDVAAAYDSVEWDKLEHILQLKKLHTNRNQPDYESHDPHESHYQHCMGRLRSLPSSKEGYHKETHYPQK